MNVARKLAAAGACLWLTLPDAAWAQAIDRRRAAVAPATQVTQVTTAIDLDGIPDEPAWLTADSISDFIQSEPHEGQPATERTVVRFLSTPPGLYVGLWAYDSVPSAIRRTQLRRDAEFDSDDSFTLVLDPLRSHRTGYLFSVNPNGAMADAEVINFETTNPEWDGVWDARARVTGFGWTAELFIPWHTLRYRRRDDMWGVNCRRIIRRKNEEVLWRAWKRTEGILVLSREGAMAGFSALPPRTIAEFRPYSTVAGQVRELRYPPDGPDSVLTLGGQQLKLGLDAKLAVAPTLTLDLTANTDFAQVEADNQVINLTRFPLFFPEKRPFFLESSGIFGFGQTERTMVFYSRRIGLDTLGHPVPLVAGARLTGRVGRDQVGWLALRTGNPENAVDLVFRVRHDVFARGYVGALLTNQSGPGVPGDRLAAGADLNVPFFVHDQNLVVGAWAAGTRDSVGAPVATAWRLSLDFPNDLLDNFVGISRIARGFDPALGFVLETDVLRHTGHIDIAPRPHHFGIRRLEVELFGWERTAHLDGTPSHALYVVSPLGAVFQSGDRFLASLQRLEDAPAVSFEIFPGHTVTPGDYYYNRAAIGFTSSAGRSVGFDLTTSAGDFYTGTSTELSAAVTVRTALHVVTNVEVDRLAARLATGRFTARTARVRFDLAATPRLGSTLFLQWDNASDRLTVNARFHWIPRPGSDAYLVWNNAWPTGLSEGIPWRRPARGALVGKVVYYFRL